MDANGDNIYVVDVVASDGVNQTVRTLTFEIRDVNLTQSVGVQNSAFVDENQPYTDSFIITDDFETGDLVSISLEGDDAEFFEIAIDSQIEGITETTLSLIAPQDFENPLDANGDNIYTVDLITFDGVNRVVDTINVTINNVIASTPPVITTEVPEVISVDQGNEFVIDIDAFDTEGDDINYFLFGPDRLEFSVDSETGAIFFRDPPLFNPDNAADNFFSIRLRVDDGNTNELGEPNFVFQDLVIEVVDADVPPEFSGLAVNPFISENREYSDSFTVTDLDEGEITLSLAGADAAFFRVSDQPNFFGMASLTLVNPLDFENPQDADGNNRYIVDVIASDGVNTTVETIVLRVEDLFESENAPVFTTPETFTVDEGQLFVANINATDADNEAITYSIVGGADRFDFEIDSASGELTFEFTPRFVDPRDRDQDNIYEVIIQADDGTENATTQTLNIEVLDIEFAPTLTIDGGLRVVDENEAFSRGIEALDTIDGQMLTFSLEGPDAEFFSLFDIRPIPGELSAELELSQRLDFENPLDADGDNVYEVDIVVSDGINRTVETFALRVRDQEESPNAPIFDTPDVVTVNEGEEFVLRVNAEDADGDPIRYTITGGEDRGLFFVNLIRGTLEFRSPPEFNEEGSDLDNFYTVEVEANDLSGNRTVQTITVEVLDVEFAPVFGSTLVANRTLIENSNFRDFFSARDLIDNDEVTISLEGVDAAFFFLDNLNDGVVSASATLELFNPLDFENPQDADGDNVYVVDVVASDGVNRTAQTVELTITDDPSDNMASAVVMEDISISNLSPDAEFFLEVYLADNIIEEFGDQFVSIIVFEPAQESAIDAFKAPMEDDIWTIKSVAIDAEFVSNESVATVSFDEANPVVEEDIFELAAPDELIDDLWMWA